MLSSVAPQVARETDSCEKVQGTRRDVHASPGARDGQRGGEDSPPREQFYRNEISNCFSLSCPSSRSIFRANFVIILELFRWNSEKFRLLLVVTLHMEKLFF